MVNKNKDRSFERIAYRYWEKLVGGILVPGERGYVPSEGEVLCAYNELKERHLECDCIVLRTGTHSGEFYQQGDKIAGVRIVRQLDSVGTIEFRLSTDFHVRLDIEGLSPLSRTEACCDLSQTISNFENFIDNFPRYMEGLERKKLGFEKNNKLEEMAKGSIRTTVSQILPPLGYRWDLVERGRDYLLKVGGHGTWMEFTLNRRNFAKRLAELPDVLGQIEALSKNMTFPMNIEIIK